jgi:hypothetical protein
VSIPAGGPKIDYELLSGSPQCLDDTGQLVQAADLRSQVHDLRKDLLQTPGAVALAFALDLGNGRRLQRGMLDALEHHGTLRRKVENLRGRRRPQPGLLRSLGAKVFTLLPRRQVVAQKTKMVAMPASRTLGVFKDRWHTCLPALEASKFRAGGKTAETIRPGREVFVSWQLTVVNHICLFCK